MDPDPHFRTFGGRRYNVQGVGDPSFGSTNLNASVQSMDFSISMRALLEVPLESSDTASGYVRAQLNSFDANSKLESHSNGLPLYRSMTDRSVEQSLFDVVPTLSDASGNVAYAEFQPRKLTHPSTTDFGVELNYSLTPQAEANFHMDFVVVPEPSTIALGLIGRLGLMTRASRRRR